MCVFSFCHCRNLAVVVNVEYFEKNLSAYIDGVPIFTVGNNLDDVKSNITEVINLYLEDNIAPLDMFVGEYELQFKIDIVMFLNYYSSIFTKAALSRITYITKRRLRHYTAGAHKPCKAQLEKIQKGIVTLTKELGIIVLN